MKKIVHIIPVDGIGGVEVAAATSEGKTHMGMRLERLFVFDNVRDRTGRFRTFNPATFWKAAGRLKQANPDLIIMSLWRSVIVGALVRLRGCRAPMVLFLHSASDAHVVDRRLTRWAAKRATAVWADSEATLRDRLDLPKGVLTRVISYVVVHRDSVRGAMPNPAPIFVFWGRLAAPKNLTRTLSVFHRLLMRVPDARLTIIGPDGGSRNVVEAEITKRALGHAVFLVGPMDRRGIEEVASRASFYLQTSKYEGMALSVMEAMQAGLVPVVTPVGEIANYTQPGFNAVWIQPGHAGEDGAVEAILNLLSDGEEWRALRSQALAEWADQTLYAEDVLAAAGEILADH